MATTHWMGQLLQLLLHAACRYLSSTDAWYDTNVNYGDHVVIANVTFQNCNSTAVKIRKTYWRALNVTFVNCKWLNNAAASYGGAVAMESVLDHNPVLTEFIDCVFQNNTAGKAGGAIYLYNSQPYPSSGKTYPAVQFKNTAFTSNSAGQYGAAISAGW